MTETEHQILRLKGKRASGGLVVGPAHLLGDIIVRDQTPAGTSDDEVAKLRSAIAAASETLETLAATSGDMGGEILGFQIALLEDDALIEPAIIEIEAGTSAAKGWRDALDEQIADYAASDDDYFRARAEDLTDLRDRVLAILTGADFGDGGMPDGAVVVGRELTPSRFLTVDWHRAGGLALAGGSPSSHVAMLARARGLAMAVGLGEGISALHAGEPVVLDADAGQVVSGLGRDALEQMHRDVAERARQAEEAKRLLPLPATTRSGQRVITTVNVDDPAVLSEIPVGHCDGIGLTRTEFLFHDRADLPGEDEQAAVYRRLLDWADGRPVTVRTLDAGGDKPIPGLTLDGEGNPFLGLRGLRLSLARTDVFEVQLRALARASAHGVLKIMFPMVTAPWELDRARELTEAALAAVAKDGAAVGKPAIGMMVEVPAAAIEIDRFDADFFSIGSNDLIQYVTASSRDSAEVSDLYDPLNPAVLRLITRITDHGVETGKEVSVCGDMAAEAPTLTALLDCGVRSVSVGYAALARAKATVADYVAAP